jgi:exonuclease III
MIDETDRPSAAPSIYLLNAAALSKPHANQQLAAELASYSADVAVVTETHFKNKHVDSVVGVDGYTVFRRDRARRKGGGVAVYVRSSIKSSVWAYSADDRKYELHWVRVSGNTFVAAIYHPPKPLYKPAALLDYIEACVEELNREFPTANIVLAGDLNQLPDQDLVERTGLTPIVHQPTRGRSILDRIYVSSPQLYSIVRVVASVVKSDHKAVVAYSEVNQCAQPKTAIQRTFRPKTPAQHALFLQYVANLNLENPHPTASSDPSIHQHSGRI